MFKVNNVSLLLTLDMYHIVNFGQVNADWLVSQVVAWKSTPNL